MREPEPAPDGRLSRPEISATVSDWGWRLVLGTLVTQVPAASLAESADLAARLTAFLGGTADRRLSPDPRSDRLLLSVQAAGGRMVTGQEVDLAHRISAFMRTLGLNTDAIGAASGAPRPAQGLEIAIDALDIAAVRPFWQAVLGYTDEPGAPDAGAGLVDPLGQARRSGSSRWTRRGRSATGSTSTCRCRTTRRGAGSRRRWPPAARWPATPRRPRAGCWPTPRATRRACAPGRAATPSANL
jgi:hypothetical protein